MIKLVTPMKRRAGMSVSAFREYYENHHRLIGEKYLKGFATKYIRRFTTPLPDRSGKLIDPEYDVFLEIWYPDEETLRACVASANHPDIQREIREDEERLFDMTCMRSYLIDEFESDMVLPI
ncbi:MAG: EthD domain-containing protein [Desulfobacterales bacterium]|jgi:hypothetical protein|nr:EthD domain-containing protein [Desulfobacterales bacterium]